MAFRIYRGIWQFQKADGSFENKYKLNQSGELVLTDTTGTVELGPATVTQADADSRYLLLAGGTVTGAAHFTHTSNTYAGASATITGRVQGGDVISTSGRFGSSADGGQDCYIYISDANNTYQEYTYGADFSFAGDTSYSNSVLIAGGLQAAKGVRAAKFYINDGNTKLEEGSGDALRITTTTGYIDIGSKNTGWIHFEGNRPYYFGNSLSVDGNVTPYSNNIRNLGGPSQRWSTIYGLNGDFSGDLVVGGTVTAQEFRTEYITQAVILQSGSTVFGNTYDDTHRYTGSLEILGSGSTILDVQGSQGQLFSVTDSLEGTLMSVNDISGLPILEVTSDDKVVMGTYNQNTLVVNGDKVGIGTASPSAKLHLYVNSANDDTFHIYNSTIRTHLLGSESSNGVIYLRNSSNSNTIRLNSNGNSYLNGGNVGIGITSPTDKLHVDGNIKTHGFLNIDTSTTTPLVIQGTELISRPGSSTKIVMLNASNSYWQEFGVYTNGAERFTINASGNVGIGTTSPDIYGFGGKLLSVNGGTSYTNLILAGDVNSGIAFGTSSARLGQITMDSTNGMSLYSSGAGTGFTMVLNRSGNVGIGTTNPGQKLHVAGAIYSTAFVYGEAHLAFTEFRVRNNENYRLGTNGTDFRLNSVNDITFSTTTSYTERMRITSSGNVGIGTTSPTYKLDVETADDIVASFVSTDNKASINIKDNDTSVFVSAENAKASFGFNVGVHANNLNVDSSGNAGIGTTSPGARLSIQNSGTTDSIISEYRMTNGSNAATFRTDDNVIFGIHSQNSGDIYIKDTSDNVLFYGKNGGNVGIGTTSPAYKLDVAGGDVRLAQDYSQVFINGITLRGYPQDNFWVIGNSTRASINIGASWNWDMQVAIAYTPNTAGAGQGGLAIGQITKNSTSWTHGSTSFYTLGEERMRINSGGNVGIGTTSPVSHSPSRRTLVVADTVNGANVEIWGDNGGGKSILQSVGGNTYVGNLANGSGAGTTYVTSGNGSTYTAFLANGNIGIGTTSPGYKLDIRTTSSEDAQIALRNTSSGAAGIYFDASNGDLIGSDYVWIGQRNDLLFDINTSSGAGDIVLSPGGTEKVRFAKTGNVGIGTTAPSSKLHIVTGTPTGAVAPSSDVPLLIDSSGNQFIEFRTTSAASGLMQGTLYSDNGKNAFIGYKEYTGAVTNTYGESIHIAVRDFSASDAGSGIYLGATSNPTLGVTTPYMFIKGNGNVGIGTTNPANKIDVAGVIKIDYDGTYGTGYGAIGFGGLTNGYNRIFGRTNTVDGLFLASATGMGIYFRAGGGSTEHMTVSSSGNVGIATTAPSYKLDVNGTIRGGTSYRTSIDGNGSGAYISFGSANDIDSLGIIGAYGGLFNISSGNGDISFQFNNTERMRITTAGNVGIGTTSPSEKLQINGGNIWAPGDVRRVILGDLASTGDVHFGSSGLSSPATGSQDYGFYAAHNAYRTSTGAWLHSRTSTIPAVRLLGSAGVSSGNQGFSFDYSANVGTAAITWTNLMQILPTGNVGIGTPQAEITERLNVQGNIRGTGNLTIDGSIAASGYNSGNWNTAYSWGNHASAGYTQQVIYSTGTDLNTFSRTSFGAISTGTNSTNRHQNYAAVYSLGVSGVANTLQIGTASDYNASGIWVRQYNLNTASPQGAGWQNWTKVWTDNDFANNSTNWNTAYSWGNHANAGYTTISTPGTPGLSSKATNGDGIAMTITAASNAEYYEIWSSINSTTNYGLVGKIDPSSVASTMSFQDDTPATTGTIYYRVYGINKGKYGTPLEFSHAFSYTCPDPATVTIASTLNMFMITWEPVQSRLCSGYTVTHHASSGTPTQGSATTIYTGKNTVALYPIPDGELDLNHQFWVTANTNT